MSTAYGGGGGGGFGGFPYRSAHQQGTDGRGGRGGRGRRRRYPRKRKTPPSLLCAADIVIPADQRVRLIGRGGSVIKQLRESTGATIFVPNNDNNVARRTADKRPVRVKAESVASLLHACWKIVHLGLNAGESASCKVRIPSNAKNLCGRVERNARFFSSGQTMAVYCVESFLDAEEVDTIVDNETFANNTNAQHETVYLQLEQQPSTLIFVYGQEPQTLHRALQEATVSFWNKECLSVITPVDVTLPSGALTVGTYNLLHPHYANKYKEYAGLTKSGDSNWNLRAPAIARLLLESNLDLYLLQEMETNGLLTMSEVTNQYHVIQYVHPSREAGDSVAILARKDRFTVESQDMLPYKSKENHDEQYMCAATALLKDTATNLRYLVASTHFYTKKSHQPHKTLLEHLETRRNECDMIIWGGDCNDEYKRAIPSGYSCRRQGHRCTRGQKRIDWIFFSPDCKAWRSDGSEAFVDATRRDLEPTGFPSSDHFGEAITLSPLETL